MQGGPFGAHGICNEFTADGLPRTRSTSITTRLDRATAARYGSSRLHGEAFP